MLAFANWSSISRPGTHYQLGAIFQMLPCVVETHIHELLAMGVTAISFTTDIWTSDVSPISTQSLTAVGGRGLRTEESSRMCCYIGNRVPFGTQPLSLAVPSLPVEVRHTSSPRCHTAHGPGEKASLSLWRLASAPYSPPTNLWGNHRGLALLVEVDIVKVNLKTLYKFDNWS